MAANRHHQPAETGHSYVSPFYYEAKNEITRPGHFVSCSRYLVEKWLERLGPLGFSLVLYLRSLGYYNPATGERRDSLQINQADLCAVLGVSLDTLQREMKRNTALQAFVQIQKSYQRKQAGHLLREDSIYHIAMDDPLAPEDEPRLTEILARKETEAKEGGKGQPFIRPVVSETEDRKPQIAAYGEGDRKPQFAVYGKGDRKPQIAAYMIDILNPLDIPKNNNIPAGAAASENVVVASCATLVEELITIGVTRKVAERLLATQGEALVKAQLQALPHRKCDDPAATLVRAIQENWQAPAAAKRGSRRRLTPSAVTATPELSEEAQAAALAAFRKMRADLKK